VRRAFDMRNHGSSGFVSGGAYGMDRDVVAAGRLLVARGVQKLFVAGASAGGTASIVAAADLAPNLAGVVSLSGPAQFADLNASAAAAKLAVPSLFVAASDDGSFAADARALFDAVPVPDKELEIVPGRSHGTALLGSDVNARLLGFLAKH
jgi:pimeloyl-ACP methyl ester carboxylesterase